MKRDTRVQRWLGVALMMGALVFQPDGGIAGVEKSPKAGTGVKEEAREALQKAFEQSKKEGKPVEIDLELDLKEAPGKVQKGDLVEVHYTARDEEGRVVFTTRSEVSKDDKVVKAEGYREPTALAPEQLVAGQEPSPFSLGFLILGMEPGQSKTVNIPPERAFGKPDPKKRQQFPCSRSMPRVVRLSAPEYTGRYKAFPKLDQEVEWTPYFGARIREITDTDVALELLAKDGQQVEEPFGQALISANDQEVKITLTPRLGAPFEMQDQEGKIVASDGLSFTVDFNPPLAGKGAVVDLQVVGLTKASAFKDKEISWIEDHDGGLAAARSQGKPVVLVLYADWCNFCQRFFDETLQDPRIKAAHENYVWLRINSDKEKKYHEQYQQNGFPLIVLMDQDGQVMKKIDGFRDAGAFRTELAALSAQLHAKLKE